jgi:hypothetical protein
MYRNYAVRPIWQCASRAQRRVCVGHHSVRHPPRDARACERSRIHWRRAARQRQLLAARAPSTSLIRAHIEPTRAKQRAADAREARCSKRWRTLHRAQRRVAAASRTPTQPPQRALAGSTHGARGTIPGPRLGDLVPRLLLKVVQVRLQLVRLEQCVDARRIVARHVPKDASKLFFSLEFADCLLELAV